MTFRTARTKPAETAISLERLGPAGNEEPSIFLSPGLFSRLQLSALQELEIDLDELLGELPKLLEIVELLSN